MAWAGRLPSAMLADACSGGVCKVGAKPEYSVTAVAGGGGGGFRAVVQIPLLPHMGEEDLISASNKTPLRCSPSIS